MVSIQADHDLSKTHRIVAPRAQDIRSFLNRNDRTHRIVDREAALPQHPNYLVKVFRKGIPRSHDVQFFLQEQPGLVRDRVLCVTNVDYATGKGDFLDGRAESLRKPDRLDGDIRPEAVRQLEKPIVERFAAG